MSFFQRLLHRPFFIRLLHWEYWSMTAVYGLIYPVFAFLCIRSGFRYFFTAANPRIPYGGFLMEPKQEIYDSLPAGYSPGTIRAQPGADPEALLAQLRAKDIGFPVIIKPDIGMRGLAVKKAADAEALRKITACYDLAFLVQEFIPYSKEAGVFYYRFPGEVKGKISGIVAKEFVEITGDGKQNLYALLQNDKRYLLQLPALEKEYGEDLQAVPAAGERKLLVPYGNHARGARFLDHSHLISPQLEKTIDLFCRQVPDFYYGRLDIRYESWEKLEQGKNFSVIELNGAGSEPTHIYDPRHSLFFAWKEIIRHWLLLFRISRLNHKKGHPYMTLAEGRQMFRANNRYVKKLEALHQRLLSV